MLFLLEYCIFCCDDVCEMILNLGFKWVCWGFFGFFVIRWICIFGVVVYLWL